MAPPKSKRKAQRAGASSGKYSDLYKQSVSRTEPPVASSAATVTASATAAAPAREVSMRSSHEVDWAGEYGYVLADLKYLGLVTAMIAGAIIVVGIFI